jgi:PAS domain S-box-containing protein
MGELIRSKDWSQTSLGPMGQWPQTLFSNLATILESPFPLLICWGRELTMLYNDAYRVLLGAKHVALGKSILEVWAEAREIIEPLIAKALVGESVLFENAQFTLLRHGYPEQTWFDFSFSPLRDERGNVVGLLNTTFETTKRKRELRENEERYQTLFESIDEGFCIIQMIFDEGGRPVDYRFVEVNPAFEMHTGLENVVGRRIRDVVPAHDEHWFELYGQVARTGETIRIQQPALALGRFYDVNAFRVGKPDQHLVGVLFNDITRRRETEERLSRTNRELERESARTRAILESMAEGLVVADPAGNIIEMNPAGLAIHEFGSLDEIRRNLKEYPDLFEDRTEDGSLVPVEEWPMARALSGEVFTACELWVTRKDTGTKWIGRYSGAPVRDGDGNIIMAVITLEDITELKQAELELQGSEQRFRATFEQAAVGMAHVDLSGRFLRVNEKFFQITGYPPDELLQLTFQEITHPEDLDLDVTQAKRLLSGEIKTYSIEKRYIRKNGTEVWINLTGSLVSNGEGKPSYFIAVVEDITERKQAEEALRASEARYSSLFHNMTEEVHFWEIVRDEKGEIGTWRLVDANPPTLKTWGKTLQEIKGKTTDEIFGQGATEHYLPIVRKIIAENAPYTFEDYFPHLDKHFRFTSIPMENHFITTGADITAIKKVQEHLERQVKKRTTELEQANRAKDEFLANMSHEIRTPMAGVLGLTEILLHHHELPAQMHEDLEMIRSSSASVMTLINDLFDLSRIQEGKLEFHPEEFDLRSTVRNAIGPFEFQARSMDLEFSVSFDETVPSLILCDKDRLGQVIKNLVSNAIKFTEQGYVRLHVNAEKSDEDTLRLNFAVADTGVGIPKSKQSEVFSAFTQLDPSYSKKFSGMGLGLAISKSLVEGMGGEISVESTKGKGATFRFFVTCGIVTEEQELSAPSITLNDLPPMTILLAEDNPVNRLFLRRALITAGHAVFEVENGVQALEILPKDRFDIILMDIQMPEMDGVEATRLIRSGRHGRADIPIIALTAYAMKGDREKFLDNGMDGYVTKPVDFGELARVIAEVVTASS